jgi:hypothetical protein
VPDFSISMALMTVTGLAGEPAAIGMSEPVTTNFSIFWVSTETWALASEAPRTAVKPQRRKAGADVFLFMVGLVSWTKSGPPGEALLL